MRLGGRKDDAGRAACGARRSGRYWTREEASMTPTIDPNATPRLAPGTLWIAVIAGLSVAGSLAFACVAPLAAIAALAALTMGRAEGGTLVVTAWLANQIVGFGVHGYPLDAGTFAWGAAIGAAALFGFLAAYQIRGLRFWEPFRAISALVVAYAAYEVTLYAAAMVLGGSETAFTPAILGHVFAINAVAFAGFLILERAAVALALKPMPGATAA
jgi:hypothetical protein